jgi:hypothetical protein
MIYQTTIQSEAEGASEAVKAFISSGATIDIKKVSKKRSSEMNRYLHKILTIFCDKLKEQYGESMNYTLEEAKIIIKRELGFTYIKNNHTFDKSTVTDSKELSEFIDRFKEWAVATFDIYLPDSE